MAHPFMDLCFDVITVHEHAFGKVPDQNIIGHCWFEEKSVLLEQEMKLAVGQAKPNTSVDTRDQEHQMGLVGILHAAIDQQPCCSTAVVRLAKTMIFTTVQLLDALYNAAVSCRHQSIH